MKKRRLSVRVLCCALALLMLSATLAACGSPSKPKIEENKGELAATYPYVVHTKSATWYLAADDITLLGEDAFYEGLYQILENQEQDFADAREALKGFIDAEIPPIEIHTDFCNKAVISGIAGAYYHPQRNFIKVFDSWEMAESTLLHEYVHYLTIHCTQQPATYGFYAEGVANYISAIVCKNRMARSVNFGCGEQELATYKAGGAWDESENCLDLPKYFFGTAQVYTMGAMNGMDYYSVSDIMEPRTDPLAAPLIWHVSHAEAACIMAYLVETYGRDTVLQNLGTAPEDFETVYGLPFPEAYQKWIAWNTQKCAELGLNFDDVG